MPHTEHDFEAAYGPVLKQFVDGMAHAVQHLLMKTHDAQKALGASPQVLAEITDSIGAYRLWHNKRFP